MDSDCYEQIEKKKGNNDSAFVKNSHCKKCYDHIVMDKFIFFFEEIIAYPTGVFNEKTAVRAPLQKQGQQLYFY